MFTHSLVTISKTDAATLIVTHRVWSLREFLMLSSATFQNSFSILSMNQCSQSCISVTDELPYLSGQVPPGIASHL